MTPIRRFDRKIQFALVLIELDEPVISAPGMIDEEAITTQIEDALGGLIQLDEENEIGVSVHDWSNNLVIDHRGIASLKG